MATNFWTEIKSFEGLTIERRLTVLGRGAAWAAMFVVALIATALAVLFVVERRASNQIALRETVRLIQVDVLQARRREKDFLLRDDEVDVARHAEEMKRFYVNISSARQYAPDDETLAELRSVENAMKSYEERFGQLVQARLVAGLDENKGLHGRMREAVRSAEAAVREVGLDGLTASNLQMRRHEKDYIQRRDPQYLERHRQEGATFNRLLANVPANVLGAAQRGEVRRLMDVYQQSFAAFVEADRKVVEAAAAARDAARLTEPLTDGIASRAETGAQRAELTRDLAALMTALLVLGVVITGGLLLVRSLRRVTRSIVEPMNQLLTAVKQLEGGDDSARARLNRTDEIGQFASAFDSMMDVRVANLKRENERLNDSVLSLLQAVAQLSRKDLTVKVPVTEDVTGPVADALNLLTGETAKVLQQVTDISADVTAASLRVKAQSDSVMSAAQKEMTEVEQTASSLEQTSKTMAQIADIAQQCNQAASRAIQTTRDAFSTVTNTVGGINSTRDTIRETEKRIKRLGERSQEITVAVNLINSIAERTHILALNASMHAASAGEAGRGFAVVADEVQRLAENARQATQQIATLVNNIQHETSDTVTAMNSAISQVVEGSKLAEQAGRQMQVAQETTSELVSAVQRIAEQSQQQARSSSELLARASLIKQSTQETSRQLSEQTQQTNLLVEYAKSLLSAVRVFKLSSNT